jgi:membrane-bound serine protease (ClpP class)
MDGLLASLTQDPNLVYLILVVGGWVGVVALFIPGTGVIELMAGLGLLIGLGGLLGAGANVIGLLLVAVAFVAYALTILRRVTASGQEPWPVSAWVVALFATVAQMAGGLLIAEGLSGLSPWLVLVMAVISLAVYRWMLLPVVTALRPPPQSGAEALIGHLAEVRSAPGVPGKSAMIFLNGELWQAICDDPLIEGDQVRVLAREGMRLRVEKTSNPAPGA